MQTDSLNKALKEYFGFSELRYSQKPIISSVMNGKDVMAILKTSGGKSLCYQLPAVYRQGTTLVISPLISLMKDQVDALDARGIPSAYVNSNLTTEEIHKRYQGLSKGAYRLFYVAPERFRDPGFLEALGTSGINTIAIDEAHCASQWGHDFRPDYSRIGASIAQLEIAIGRRVQRLAFTATATPKVQDDIIKMLGLISPDVHVQDFDRDNISYSVVHSDKNRNEDLAAILAEHANEPTIVYCVTVKKTEELYTFLNDKGIKATRYHGRLSPEQKNQVQEDFISGKINVLVSTSAFGMGIDKSDIRLIVHAQMPGSLEAWYQEAGRAGRDGKESKAILLYDSADRNIHRFFIDMGIPTSDKLMALRSMIYRQLVNGPSEINVPWLAKILRIKITPIEVEGALNLMIGHGELTKHDKTMYTIADWQRDPDYSWVDEVRKNNWQKVNAMQQWCETNLCRRWLVLKYFGQRQALNRCGKCDTCQAEALSRARFGATAAYVRPVTLMNFSRAVTEAGPRWKNVLLGTIASEKLKPNEVPWAGRFTYYAVGDLERWLKLLCKAGFVDDLELTHEGKAWLEGTLKHDFSSQLAASERQSYQPEHGITIEDLHKWRKLTAYADDVSEMSVATEAILKKVCAARTFKKDDLLAAGLRPQWVDNYGHRLEKYREKVSAKKEKEPSI